MSAMVETPPCAAASPLSDNASRPASANTRLASIRTGRQPIEVFPGVMAPAKQ
jgi:hypothetical protein